MIQSNLETENPLLFDVALIYENNSYRCPSRP